MLPNNKTPLPFWGGLTNHPGIAEILTDPADCWPYGTDNSQRHHAPDAVLFPTTPEAVQAIVQHCLLHNIPITARGRGTNTTGSSVPIQGGVVLCFDRMDKILSFNPKDRLMIVQPGVLNSTVQTTAQTERLFWPPDPSSQEYCTVGGNLAHNAAGPRAVKYGTCRENTLGLTFIDGHGQLVKTGTQTTKGVVGYDLTRLLIGSEGTLGIIVEATLKLTPQPPLIATLQAFYTSELAASEAVVTLMQNPTTPCTLEIVDTAALQLIRQFDPTISIPKNAKAMLLIEVDGTPHSLPDLLEHTERASHNKGLLYAERAHTPEERRQVWSARKALSPALKHIAPHKINEDIAIPISQLPTLFSFIEELRLTHPIHIVTFGHAGNGNLHVNILYNRHHPDENQHATQCLEALFQKVLALHGTLSGEHGIGLQKKMLIGHELSKESLKIMQNIKHLFDPQGIFNPGKWV